MLVIWGLGQLGGTFAHGLLRLGYSVRPITRSTNAQSVAAEIPTPKLVLVAVGEDDLAPVLSQLPHAWRGRVALLQNELVPHSWQAHGIADPSVCIVWFEKKAHSALRVVLPSVCYGPSAQLLNDALHALAIPVRIIAQPAELHFELALKNLYVLTINCAGLRVDADVGTLWSDHREATMAIASDLIELQGALIGAPLDKTRLMRELERAIVADPRHVSKGRTAPARLVRCLAHADRLGLDLPALRRLSAPAQPRQP
jgi:hypothetical protein